MRSERFLITPRGKAGGFLTDRFNDVGPLYGRREKVPNRWIL
jgi:hypothetical protein